MAALFVVAVGGRPASAHFCSIPAQINVGEDVTINIGVAAENKPVRDVEVEIPNGFTFKESFGYLGYVGTKQGKWVHFTGAEIQPYTCHYFAIAGRAEHKGRFVSRIITTADDGTRQRYEDLNPNTQFPAMLIFAGIPVQTDFSPKTSSGGVPVWLAGVVAVAAGAAAVGIAVFVQRRRTP